MRFAVLIPVVVLGVTAFGQEFIASAKQEYRLERPVLVAGPQVGYASWSPNGNHLLMLTVAELSSEMADKGRTVKATVSAWSPGEKQPQPLYSFEYSLDKLGAVTTFSWFPNLSTCLMKTKLPADGKGGPAITRIVQLDVAQRTSKVVGDFPNVSFAEVSPKSPVGLIVRQEPTGVIVTTVLQTGETTRRFELGKDKIARGWFADGRLTVLPDPKNEALKATKDRWAFDPVTQELTVAPATLAAYVPPSGQESNELRLVRETATVKHGTHQSTTHPLWIEGDAKSEAPAAMLAADVSTDGELAADNKAICYLQQGSLWVVRLKKLKHDEFVTAKREAMQAALWDEGILSGMKFSVRLDTGPDGQGKGSFITLDATGKGDGNVQTFVLKSDGDKLEINGKDASGVRFSGSPQIQIVGPGQVTSVNGNGVPVVKPEYAIVGYINTPVGRAVVYKDGHVRWEAR